MNSYELEEIYNKHPDIHNDLLRIEWLFSFIIPQGIKTRLENKNDETLMEIAGLVGLWSVFTESGNGCNSWLLIHPITLAQFKYIVTCILHPDRTHDYARILFVLKLSKGIGYTTTTLPHMVKLNNEILDNINPDIFDSLSDSVDYIKNIVNKYNLREIYNISCKYVYLDDMIPSPSGMTVIPFIITP